MLLGKVILSVVRWINREFNPQLFNISNAEFTVVMDRKYDKPEICISIWKPLKIPRSTVRWILFASLKFNTMTEKILAVFVSHLSHGTLLGICRQ